jgi:CHASE2 domain-containing sensor protein
VSNTNTQAKNGGVGFLGLLGLIFITLKLTGYIKWSWLWVLAPFWIPAIPIALICLVWLVATIGLALIKRHEQKQRAKAAKPKFVSDLDRRR